MEGPRCRGEHTPGAGVLRLVFHATGVAGRPRHGGRSETGGDLPDRPSAPHRASPGARAGAGDHPEVVRVAASALPHLQDERGR